MSGLVSFEDVFVIGIGFDIAGAYLLAKGLLLSSRQILRLSSSYFDFNPAQVVARVDDKVSTTLGLTSLVIGFLCQLAGYVGTLALAAPSSVSAGRGVAAAILAVVTIGAVLLTHRLALPYLRRQLLLDIAHYDNSGKRQEIPYGFYLLHLGAQAHMALPKENESQSDYALRVWRVDRITEGGPTG
jgi:hypothetical protein